MGRFYLKAGCRYIQDILNTANELLQSCRAGKKNKSHVLWYLTQTAHPHLTRSARKNQTWCAQPVHHGGPRSWGIKAVPGAGSWRAAAIVLMTLSRPTLHAGHSSMRNLSIPATRAMKASAHSSACALSAGICKAWRAWSSLTVLQPEASTP